MQFGTHFSARKLRRKLDASGPWATCVASAELLSRKLLFTPLFATLLERGALGAVSRERLLATHDVHPLQPPDGRQTASSDADPESSRFVVAVPGGYVLPGSGGVFTADGEFVVESVAPPTMDAAYKTIPLIGHLFHDGPRFTLDLLRGDVQSLDPVDDSADLLCPLIPRYRNYYHWTVETLPKLRMLDAFRRETGREPTLLLPDDPPSWMLESFRLLGGGEFPVRHARAPVYRADSALVPAFVYTITAEDYEWFRRLTAGLRGNTDANAGDDTDRSRRIYVSRAGARERRVHNDAAVLDALDDYGFEPYRLEELPVAEQVRLFAEAEAIVGPHGAGLSNLVYSEDVAVVELFGSNVKDNFARIAETAGFEYHRLQGRQDGPDIDIDVARLRETVERAVG